MSKARNLADVGSDTNALTTDTELGNYVGPEGFFVPQLSSDPVSGTVAKCTGGTITNDGSYTYHTFTSSGILTKI